MQDALRKRKVADVDHGEKVAIPTRGITEPNFHHSRRTGRTEHVVPGNKEYIRGDEIPRPTGGEGRGGSQGSPDGSGEDAFEFTLVEGRVPRHVFRGSRAPRSGEEEPQGDLRGRSAARRLHRHRQPCQSQHPAHDAQQHGAPDLAEAAEAMGAGSAARGDRQRPRPRRRGRGRKASARVRPARAPQQDHSLHRSDRRPLQPLRARAAAEHRGGDVLPDGCVRIDDRGDEGPRQAVLHAAACLPDPALPARRYRLHPPYQHGGRGGRGDVLLQPGDRRHRGLDRAREDAGDRAGAISDRPLEHLRGSGFRRRQLRRGQRTLRVLCWVARFSRSASISPMSRSATAWEGA